jgi:tetratricopeptide (TPR) repeat protein
LAKRLSAGIRLRIARLYQLGRTSVLSGLRLERGKEVFEQYIAEGKGTQIPHAHWRLGMVYEKLGRRDLAREAYETALQLDPEIEQAREALRNLGK